MVVRGRVRDKRGRRGPYTGSLIHAHIRLLSAVLPLRTRADGGIASNSGHGKHVISRGAE